MTKFFYRVQKGDTITSISQQFCIPQIKIISLNNLDKEVQEGDLLYLEKEKALTYKVGLFEDADIVAKKFNMTKTELLRLNGIDYVFYGQTVLVKG